MNRRDFLRSAGLSALAVLLPPWLRPLAAAALPDMVIAQGGSPQALTLAAIEALGGMRRFVSPGDVVVVKPNIGWDRTPEYAANTNPEVVAAITGLCLKAGAKKVKVFDNPVNDARRCYLHSGIAEAARRAGAEVHFMESWKFKDVRIKGATDLKSWPLYSEALEADKFINVPIAKTHGLSKLTLGMKNLMGVMGGHRSRIHWNIDANLVDITRHIKPTLTVLDAVRILSSGGPQGGDLRAVRSLGTVAVSTDPVAIDAFGATLFGLQPAELGYVRLGAAAGLGRMDLDRMQIKRIRV